MNSKRITLIGTIALIALATTAADCDGNRPSNTTAKDEQARTELNQRGLFTKQPPPGIDWSLERDNLRNRIKLMNDRSVMFFMYVFIEGSASPIGYYQINKVSSVDSQLTNTMQLVHGDGGQYSMDFVLPSPSEDGSYGTNGEGVFGFSPEGVYIETNLKYLVSTIPLKFATPVQLLAVVNTDEAKRLLENSKKIMAK